MMSLSITEKPKCDAEGDGGDNEAAGDVTLELPEEIMDTILYMVRTSDNYTRDDTSACRLVCRRWRDLIDKSQAIMKPKPHVWNPYFETSGNEDAETLAVFRRTKGIYLSTVEELETLLADWDDPSVKQLLLSKTLIIDFKTAEGFQSLCQRVLGVVEERFAAHIEHFKVVVEPRMSASREILLMIPKLTNLSSLTIYLKEFPLPPHSEHVLVDPIPLDEWLSRVLSSPAPSPQWENSRLVELNMLGDIKKYSIDFYTLLCSRGGGHHIQNMQFLYHPAIAIANTNNPASSANYSDIRKLHKTVDTLKVTSEYGDGAHGYIKLEEVIPISLWRIRRFSLKLLWNRVSGASLQRLFCALHRGAAAETLEELHVLFRNENARLSDDGEYGNVMFRRYSIRLRPRRVSDLSFNSLTTLSLPFLMTGHADLLKEIVSACPKLTYLICVVTDGALQEASEATRRSEVSAEVQKVWSYAPPSVKWIYVKFRKALRESKQQRRYMTNIVWRYERSC